MSGNREELGKSAEDTACRFLKKKGYSILARNYRNRQGEIDIVASERKTICFVEVKARTCDGSGMPLEAVDPRKQRRIGRVAVAFLQEKNLLKREARFDVVSVSGPESLQKIELIRGAFDLEGPFTF